MNYFLFIFKEIDEQFDEKDRKKQAKKDKKKKKKEENTGEEIQSTIKLFKQLLFSLEDKTEAKPTVCY